jgi:hypothetical protein
MFWHVGVHTRLHLQVTNCSSASVNVILVKKHVECHMCLKTEKALKFQLQSVLKKLDKIPKM